MEQRHAQSIWASRLPSTPRRQCTVSCSDSARASTRPMYRKLHGRHPCQAGSRPAACLRARLPSVLTRAGRRSNIDARSKRDANYSELPKTVAACMKHRTSFHSLQKNGAARRAATRASGRAELRRADRRRSHREMPGECGVAQSLAGTVIRSADQARGRTPRPQAELQQRTPTSFWMKNRMP